MIATNPPATMHIVTCREDANLNGLVSEMALAPRHIYRHALNGFAAPLDAAAIERLKRDPRVLFVEADGPVKLCDQTNGSGIVRMGIDRFPLAHINGTNELLNVGVAVLDTGMDPHPDLDIYTNYWTYSPDGHDTVGHGTAVAGVLAARDNGFGVVGVAPGVRLYNVKCTGPSPNNNWNNFVNGCNYVIAHANEIAVASISISNAGLNAPISAIRGAVKAMVQAGVVVVVAAGNDARDLAGLDGVYGNGDDALPASLAEAMAVSAMDSTLNETNGLPTDQFWPSSNFSSIPRTNGGYSHGSNYVVSPGLAIDVAAPGVNILTLSTDLGSPPAYGYALYSGTSLATPHVAGLVALYIAANGRATNAEGVYAIRQAIVNASLPQSQWHATNTLDPDTNHEPLAVASEAWIPLPRIAGETIAPGGFQMSFPAVPGYNYTLQQNDTLAVSNGWTDVSTSTATGSVTLVDVTNATSSPRRFYRLSRQPAP